MPVRDRLDTMLYLYFYQVEYMSMPGVLNHSRKKPTQAAKGAVITSVLDGIFYARTAEIDLFLSKFGFLC